jgi:tetratricopeptide (TPR) repeat protein
MNYAILLQEIRKDYKKAEQFFLRAIEADPDSADNLGAYAGFVLGRGNKEKGYSLLDKAISMLPASQNPSLALKLWFFAFCHWPKNRQKKALKNLKIVLKNGARCIGRDLSLNIETARQNGHSDAKWVEVLANVITKGEDISKLDDWDEWREA